MQNISGKKIGVGDLANTCQTAETMGSGPNVNFFTWKAENRKATDVEIFAEHERLATGEYFSIDFIFL